MELGALMALPKLAASLAARRAIELNKQSMHSHWHRQSQLPLLTISATSKTATVQGTPAWLPGQFQREIPGKALVQRTCQSQRGGKECNKMQTRTNTGNQAIELCKLKFESQFPSKMHSTGNKQSTDHGKRGEGASGGNTKETGNAVQRK